MATPFPVRLLPTEEKLIAQLRSVDAVAEAERLTGTGLPTRRIESYHYTDLKALLRQVPDLGSPDVGTPANAAGQGPAIAGATRVAIVNGVPAAPVSRHPVHFGDAAGSVLTTRDDVIVRLNTSLARRTLTIGIDGTPDSPVLVDHRIEGPAGHHADSVRIFIAEGVTATIIETFSGSDAAHLANHASVVEVGAGANVTHVLLDTSASISTHFATIEYQIGAGANLRSVVVNTGASLSRTQMFARFAGEGAHGEFTGLNLLGDGQHSDITLDVNHAVPNTTSKELYKQVARGRSRAVFQGRIVVARDAQKVDAKMMMQGLMLSDEAEILAKPELEIYADDVVCGHGSTCGALDEDQFFYLLSRGISRREAESMLVRGFLMEVIEPIEAEAVRDLLEGVAEGWLAGTP